MPAADGLSERVRLDSRSRGGHVPAWSTGRPGSGRAAVPAGHDDPRDELGRGRRVDHRPRRALDRPVAPPRRALAHASAHADRLRRRPRVPADDPLRQRRGAGGPRVRAGIRLRRRARHVELRRRGLPRDGHPGRRLRRRAAPRVGSEPRHRGAAGDRPAPDEGGRDDVLRAVVERASGAAHLSGRLPAPGVDRASLAALARPRALPRPSLEDGAATKRADAEGAHVRADRGDRRSGDHLASGDSRWRAQLGLPLLLDPRRDVRAVGPVHARLRLGGQRLLPFRRRRGGGRAGPAADHVRHRRARGSARANPRAPVGI